MSQMATFNKDIREWHQKYTELKTWAHFNIFSKERTKSKE